MIVTLAVSGQPQPLGDDVLAREFMISAPSSNSGTIYIDRQPQSLISVQGEREQPLLYNGPVAADAEGIPLAPGAYLPLPGPLLSAWWMDGTAAGDKLSITPMS